MFTHPPLRILVLAYFHGLGHLMRSMAVAVALQERGHSVLFACAEQAIDIPQSAGLRCHTIRELPPFSVEENKVQSIQPAQSGRSRLADPFYLQQCLEDELALINSFSPNMILFDFRITAGISAAQAGIPSLSIFNTKFFVHPFPEIWPQVAQELQHLGIPEQSRKKLLGDVMIIPDFSFFEPLSCIPTEIMGRIASIVREIRYVGPLLRTMPRDLPDKNEIKTRFCQEETPLIFITFGGMATGFSVLKEVLEGLAGLKGHFIVVTGMNIDPMLVQEIAQSLTQNSPHTTITLKGYSDDTLQYMKAADVAIIHGGHTTVMEGILCGTPLICIPLQKEQEENAQRVVDLGVGKIIEAKNVKQEIACSVQHILSNSSLVQTSTQIATKLGRLCGTDELVTYIETMIDL
jgi:UDP:flavonoid glycosyltransferase YjiC (YdhE family)